MNLLVSEEERPNWEATIREATWRYLGGYLGGQSSVERPPRTLNQRVTTEIPLFEPTTSGVRIKQKIIGHSEHSKRLWAQHLANEHRSLATGVPNT